MTDYEWFKVLGVNGGVFATVTLTQIEAILSIILLTATIVWTVAKLVILFDEKRQNQNQKRKTTNGDKEK